MASLVEFAPAPSRFWPAIAAQEESDRNRSDAFMKRYEVLLRLSRCLTSARPEDLVASIAAELRSVVDFDLLDIVVNPETSGTVISASEDVKSQCSLPLISRGSQLGFFVVGRFDRND